MLAAVAYADNVANNLDTTIDSTAETMSLTVGGVSKTTVIYVQAVTGDGENGCNLKNDASLTVNVGSSDPAKATVSPSQVTIDGCDVGNGKTITVTPVSSGSATITFSQAAFTGTNPQGTFVYNTATFTAFVAAPDDATAPTGSVAINGNAAYTNSRSVDLDLAATDGVGVTAYRVANGSDCSSALWQAVGSTTSFSQTVAHTLTARRREQDGLCAVQGRWGEHLQPRRPTRLCSIRLAPAIQDAGVQSGTAGANGWYLSAVVGRLHGGATAAAPGLSAACSASFPKDVSTGSNEGAGVTVSSGACSDLAGNTNTGISKRGVQYRPHRSVGGADGHSRYGRREWLVHVQRDGDDQHVGHDQRPGHLHSLSSHHTAETAGQVFTGTCTNGAGLSTRRPR